jgi:hypothetical protein
MIIQNYGIRQDGMRRVERNRETSENMTFWTDPTQPESDEAQFILEHVDREVYRNPAKRAQSASNAAGMADRKTEAKLRLIEALAYQMTGRRLKLQPRQQGPDMAWDAQIPSIQARDSWGLIYEYQETMAEGDSIRFNSGGTIIAEGSRMIMFSAEFTMLRSYYEQNRVNIRMGNAVMVDPLMMAVGGDTLDQDAVAFDSDGSGECIWLGVYDLEHSIWVDSEDDIFSCLSMQPAAGDDDKTTVKLAKAGMGTIYLNEMETPFEFRDAASEYGNKRNSSVFLKEDGSVQHLDLNL